jgi:acyl carrier protein
VTGYRVESIRIEDRLQDDLGIDSLKATEVIVEILEAKRSSGATGSFVDFQHARTVGDLVQALAQREQRAFPATKKRTPHFEWVQREWVERPVPPANETYPYAACRLSELLTHGLPLAPRVLIECDLEIPAASTSEANVRAWSDQFLQCLRLLYPAI